MSQSPQGFIKQEQRHIPPALPEHPGRKRSVDRRTARILAGLLVLVAICFAVVILWFAI